MEMQVVNGRRLPLIEQEFDDEGTSDLLMLERWQDLKSPFKLSRQYVYWLMTREG